MTDRELLECLLARVTCLEAGINTLLSIHDENKRMSVENNEKIRNSIRKQMEQFPPEMRGMLSPLIDFDH